MSNDLLLIPTPTPIKENKEMSTNEQKELCEICKDSVSICTCQRCLECEKLYIESVAENFLNDENICKACTDEYKDPALNCECGYQH